MGNNNETTIGKSYQGRASGQTAEKTISQTIAEQGLLAAGDTVVFGLSGGPDSLCLFDVLQKMATERKLHLQVVHVNHKLRPGEAEADQVFVQSLCEERGVPCRVVTVDCRAKAAAEGLSEEEAGRNARYQAFFETADQMAAEGVAKETIKIAVAQNANDRAETLLLNLLRGTGTDGLASLPYKREDRSGYQIIRPLLDTFRAEVESYCARHKLKPRQDRTNLEGDYVRNRIRRELLPLLESEYNPNILTALNRASLAAAQDKEYLRKEASSAYAHLRQHKEGCEAYAPLRRREDTKKSPAIETASPSKEGVSSTEKGASTTTKVVPSTEKVAAPTTEVAPSTKKDALLTEGGTALTAEKTPSTKEIALDRKGLLALDRAIRHRVIQMAFDQIGLHQDIAFVHLAATDRLLESGKTTGRLDYPGGYTFRLVYEQVVCEGPATEELTGTDERDANPADTGERGVNPAGVDKREDNPGRGGLRTALPGKGKFKLRKVLLDIEDYQPRAGLAAFDAELLQQCLSTVEADLLQQGQGGAREEPVEKLLGTIALRTRQPGDYLRLSVGRKTIQDLLVDEKVPAHVRDQVLFAACGQEVLWIPAGIRRARYSAAYPVTPATKRVLTLEIEEDM